MKKKYWLAKNRQSGFVLFEFENNDKRPTSNYGVWRYNGSIGFTCRLLVYSMFSDMSYKDEPKLIEIEIREV